MSYGNWVRRGSSRLYLPRGFAEGEAWASRGLWVDRRYFAMLVNSHRFGGGGGPGTPVTYYLDTDGSNGDGSIGTPWNSLENARSGLISLYSSFVSASVTPTLICTGATDDTTAVTNTWPTSDTGKFLTIKTPDTGRAAVWDTSRYALVRSTSPTTLLPLGTNSIRLQGLQLSNQNGIGAKTIELTSLGGEFVCDGCLLWGLSTGGTTGIYARTAGTSGTLVIRNTFVLNSQHGFLLGDDSTSAGLLSGSEVYVYNCSHWGTGSGGEGCRIEFEASGSGRIARVKNLWMYAQANGVTVVNADTDDQATNTKGGVDTSHFVSPGNPGDWRLVSSSSNVDSGTDLSAVGTSQWQFSDDASLYTRPYNSTWDRGFYEYRP